MSELQIDNLFDLSQRIRLRALPPDPIVADLERVRQAAVTLLIGDGPEGPEVLIIRRSEHPGDPWSGHLALPGGRAEPVDQHLLATAARETYEEVGVILLPERSFIGRMEPLMPRNPLLPAIEIFPFIAVAPDAVTFSYSEEVASAFWVSLRKLRMSGLSDSHRIRQGNNTLKYPAYQSPEGPIWGITQRIISDFLKLIE